MKREVKDLELKLELTNKIKKKVTIGKIDEVLGGHELETLFSDSNIKEEEKVRRAGELLHSYLKLTLTDAEKSEIEAYNKLRNEREKIRQEVEVQENKVAPYYIFNYYIGEYKIKMHRVLNRTKNAILVGFLYCLMTYMNNELQREFLWYVFGLMIELRLVLNMILIGLMKAEVDY